MFLSPTCYTQKHSVWTLYFAHADTHHLLYSNCCVCGWVFFGGFFFAQDRGIMFNPHHYWKKLKLFTKKKACFICAPHKNTHSHSFLHTREQKQWTSMSLSSFHKTRSDWVSYLHVIAAYWYSTKGNIPSSVKKITMKQSKIILAEVPELKKVTFWSAETHTKLHWIQATCLNAISQLIHRKESTKSFSKFLKQMLVPSSLNDNTKWERFC